MSSKADQREARRVIVRSDRYRANINLAIALVAGIAMVASAYFLG